MGIFGFVSGAHHGKAQHNATQQGKAQHKATQLSPVVARAMLFMAHSRVGRVRHGRVEPALLSS